jgi:hypothetical protein
MSDKVATELADQFAAQKYAVLKGCVADPQLSLLYRYACKRAIGQDADDDGQVPGTFSAMNDVFMGGLMMEILPLAEQIARAKLFPTCSYFRVYKRDDALGKHTDRNACEVSLSICLGYEAARPWPIWIEGPQGVSSIELAPGDALVYRGIECPHWREPLEGDLAAQVFLHYVDQTGPYAQWKLDERTSVPVEEIMSRRP